MATFVLEDLGSAIEVMVFPRTMADFGHVLEDDAIICVKGRLDTRDDEPKLIAMDITRPELHLDGDEPPFRIEVRLARLDDHHVARLKGILLGYPGDRSVFVHLVAPGRTTVVQLADDYRTDGATSLCAELRELFGSDCIV